MLRDNEALLAKYQKALETVNDITTATGGKERNDLYKTIIERILYQREGDNINVKIVFK